MLPRTIFTAVERIFGLRYYHLYENGSLSTGPSTIDDLSNIRGWGKENTVSGFILPGPISSLHEHFLRIFTYCALSDIRI